VEQFFVLCDGRSGADCHRRTELKEGRIITEKKASRQEKKSRPFLRSERVGHPRHPVIISGTCA